MSTHPKAGATNRSRRPNAGDHVSKQHSDSCLNDDTARLANDADGRNAVAAIPSRTQVDRVVMDATDGYDHDLLCALQMAGIDMARVDASRAHGFADLIVVEKRPQPGGEPCPSFV
jgi:transposase